MIDWQRVTELRDEVGAEDFAEVVEIFLEEVEEVIRRLETVDAGALKDEMHFLKGSALNLGFRELAELCARIERQGPADAFDASEVARVYEDSKQAFMTALESETLAA